MLKMSSTIDFTYSLNLFLKRGTALLWGKVPLFSPVRLLIQKLLKDGRFAMGWKGTGVIVGPEVGSPTEVLHQLHSRFLPTDYGYYCSDVAK